MQQRSCKVDLLHWSGEGRNGVTSAVTTTRMDGVFPPWLSGAGLVGTVELARELCEQPAAAGARAPLPFRGGMRWDLTGR